MVQTITIGSLKRRLFLERNYKIADTAGGYQDNWKSYTQFWGKIDPASDVEKRLLTNVKINEVTHLVTIRYTEDIQLNDRFIYQGRIFYPCSIINPEENKRFLQILVKEYRIESTNHPEEAPKTNS